MHRKWSDVTGMVRSSPDRVVPGRRSDTAAQRSVTSPSRHRDRPPTHRPAVPGQPLDRGQPALPRPERRVRRAGRPGPVEGGEERVHRLARARCGGSAPSAAARPGRWAGPVSETRAAKVMRQRAAGVQRDPAGPPAQLVAGALDQQAAGRQPAAHLGPGAAAAASSYCRSTLSARTSTGRRPASSKPPWAKLQPRRVGVRRRRRRPGPGRSPGRAPARPGARRRAARPAPPWSPGWRRSRGRRPAGRPRRAAGADWVPVIHRSTRRSRFGPVVPRVGRPSARARPAANRGALFTLADRRRRPAGGRRWPPRVTESGELVGTAEAFCKTGRDVPDPGPGRAHPAGPATARPVGRQPAPRVHLAGAGGVRATGSSAPPGSTRGCATSTAAPAGTRTW